WHEATYRHVRHLAAFGPKQTCCEFATGGYDATDPKPTLAPSKSRTAARTDLILANLVCCAYFWPMRDSDETVCETVRRRTRGRSSHRLPQPVTEIWNEPFRGCTADHCVRFRA